MDDETLCSLVRAFSDRFENTTMGSFRRNADYQGWNHPGNDFNWVRGIRVKDLYEFARSLKREIEGENQ